MDNFSFNSLSSYAVVLLILVITSILAVLIGIISHYIAKLIIVVSHKILHRKLKSSGFLNLMLKHHVFQRITYLIPAIIFNNYAYLFDIKTTYITLLLADLVRTITTIYVLFGVTLVITALLNCLNDKYKNLAIAKQKPIKSYVQVIKIILFILTFILSASVLFNKSPTYFIASLGALAAVLLLVFKDSILGFVASIQLAAYDMLHIGDHIEMPSFGADGDVIDISLNTVKVQNFDKSIVTIPSYALLTSGVKNWRGMKEAGARRVKRSINIDITTIKICDEALLERLNKLSLFKDKLQEKMAEINDYNKKHDIDNSMLANGKRLTNIAAFRYYLELYLHNHPGVHKGMRLSIRELQITPTGLPIELYFFTNTTNTDIYEAMQADIMDDLYGILPAFDLRLFQHTS